MSRSFSPSRRMRACVPCSKVKARCYFQPINVDRHVCDRCDRLGIDCEAQAVSWLRRPKRAKEPEDYELDGSVSRVKLIGIQSVTGHLSRGEARRASDGDIQELSARQPDMKAILGPLTWEQADQVLGTFRDRYMAHFPFVVVGDYVSAQQLHQGKPLLFRVIMLVAAPLPPSQAEKRDMELVSEFGQLLLAEDSPSLDTLQAVLVYIAWSGSKSLRDRQVSSLIHLALGYAHTLGITDTYGREKHSLEQHRTYLGCFYLLSVHSVYFGRRNPLSGEHVDYCREAILNSQELSTDLLLDRLVRMTQMSQRLFDTLGSPQSPERKAPGYVSVVEANRDGFHVEISHLGESIAAAHLRSQLTQYPPANGEVDFDLAARSLNLQLHYLLVRLHEPAVQLPPSSVNTWLQSLESCWAEIFVYLDVSLSFASETYLYQPISWWAQLTSILSIAKRLASVGENGGNWEAELADKVSRLGDRFQEACNFRKSQVQAFAKEVGTEVADEEMTKPNQFENYARKMLLAKCWSKDATKVNEAEGTPVQPSRTGAMDTSNRSVESLGEALPGGWPSI